MFEDWSIPAADSGSCSAAEVKIPTLVAKTATKDGATQFFAALKGLRRTYLFRILLTHTHVDRRCEFDLPFQLNVFDGAANEHVEGVGIGVPLLAVDVIVGE